MKQGMFSLDGKTIIMTGGSGLIGFEAVKQMALYGAKVFLGCRNPALFTEKWENFDAPEDIIIPDAFNLDIGEEKSMRDFFDKCLEKSSRIDGLINNAFPRTSDWAVKFEDVNAESLYKNLCAHAGGYFLCSQIAAETMKKQKSGVIINIGSIYGHVAPNFPIYEGTGMTSSSPYPLIKGGIHAFTKYLAAYLAEYQIRVNCISPGGLKDEELQHPDFIKNYEKNTPLGRMAAPEDISGALIFLLSDAACYITGQLLFIDGGWTTW